MDTEQKKLIKSYYRSRSQAHHIIDEMGSEPFQAYEFIPLALENDLIEKKTLNNLNLNHLSRILSKNPTVADYVDYDKLIQISDVAIVDLLFKQPSLIKHFKHSIKMMNPYSVLKLVSSKPEYMEYANDSIFNGVLLTNLLMHQPQFYEKFKDRVDVTDVFVNIVGKEQPELIKQMFKDNLLPPSSIHDALTHKWIAAEDFTKEQLVKMSNLYAGSGVATLFLLKDHPELLKYHQEWDFNSLNPERKEDLRRRYERLIKSDSEYGYLQDIINQHLM